MSDPFKYLIDENRDAFDSQLPPPDMWARIEKAQGIRHSGILHRMPPAIKAMAAVMVLALVTTIGWQLMRTRQHIEPVASLSAIDAQVMEAAQFYESQITQKQQQVNRLTSGQPEVQQGVEQDMAELDKALRELKADLKDNVANREVLEAMIQTYRMKLDILEQILSYLEPEQQTEDAKQPEHEL